MTDKFSKKSDYSGVKNDAERNRLTARLNRSVNLGINFSGAGLGVLGSSLTGGDKKTQQIAQTLASALGKSKGPLMKIAQMLATIPDLLPPEYASEFSRLQAQAPPMGWPFVRRRMRAELGANWQTHFTSFDKQAAYSASLGQVHAARLPDGRHVACKLQYPEMASAVESDLGYMRNLLNLFIKIEKSINPSEMAEEIGNRLREELDYIREARHMALYGQILIDKPFIIVPTPVPNLCTPRLLTMSWVEGESLYDYENAPQDTRNRIAANLFWAWWYPFTTRAVIHGDPHPGNYQITQGGTGLNLLDFGCVRIFPPHFVAGVVDLYRALRADDFDAAYAAYEKWGFQNLNRPLVEALNIWARFIYGPLLDNRVRSVADGVKPADYGRKEAFAVRRLLKERGPVTIPREFVFMDRAAIGLGAAYLRLRAELNYHELFEKSLEGFNEKALANAQIKALKAANLTLGQ